MLLFEHKFKEYTKEGLDDDIKSKEPELNPDDWTKKTPKEYFEEWLDNIRIYYANIKLGYVLDTDSEKVTFYQDDSMSRSRNKYLQFVFGGEEQSNGFYKPYLKIFRVIDDGDNVEELNHIKSDKEVKDYYSMDKRFKYLMKYIDNGDGYEAGVAGHVSPLKMK
tara:strand:+ start:1146 stop:1637 length:492 start_codon:yes stop_codon:yes gene_type:complete